MAVPVEVIQPGALARPCEVHDSHRPTPLYVEQHHVVPRAWQAFWQPTQATPYAHGGLWDARTVAVCRTGHGNVHALLVAFMEAFADGAPPPSLLGHVHERLVADLAMSRWTEAGGRLEDLVAAKLFGGI